MLGKCNFVKVLGVILLNNMFMVSFISIKCQICAYLSNIRHIKKCLPHKYRIRLVCNLILSQIDYCNVLPANASNKDLKPFQKTLNDVVCFIFDLKWNDHVTTLSYLLTFSTSSISYCF